MKIIAIIVIPVLACLAGCSNRGKSATMDTFSPSFIILTVGKKHNLDFSESGRGEGWRAGHGEKDWHYFTASKSSNLDAVVGDIYEEFKKEVIKQGAQIHGNSEETHAFVVYGLTYTHGGREGSIRIIAAQLDNGTGIDVFLDEHPK